METPVIQAWQAGAFHHSIPAGTNPDAYSFCGLWGNKDIKDFIDENDSISPFRVNITLMDGRHIYGYFEEIDQNLYERNLWNFVILSPSDSGILSPVDGRMFRNMKAMRQINFEHISSSLNMFVLH